MKLESNQKALGKLNRLDNAPRGVHSPFPGLGEWASRGGHTLSQSPEGTGVDFSERALPDTHREQAGQAGQEGSLPAHVAAGRAPRKAGMCGRVPPEPQKQTLCRGGHVGTLPFFKDSAASQEQDGAFKMFFPNLILIREQGNTFYYGKATRKEAAPGPSGPGMGAPRPRC